MSNKENKERKQFLDEARQICANCGKEFYDILGFNQCAECSGLKITKENTNTEGGYYYELFKFFNEQHDLTLLDIEIQDIIYAVNKFQNKQK